MDNKFLFENNKPILFLSSMPWLKNIAVSKIFSLVLIIFAVVILITSGVYLFFKNAKAVNTILISRESTLNAELTKMENRNDMLEAEIFILKNQVKDLDKQNDKKKLKRISKYLADSDVIGYGVEILLKDNNSVFAPIQESNTIIHNNDLLKIVNFLWKKGATAISINGERIVFNSHISCVGPTILINKKRINSPFSVSAIGENLLAEEIKNESFMLSLKLRGIEFEISEKDDVFVPAGKYVVYSE